MKKMNKLTMAALALAALGFASTAASAAITPGADDLVLGFEIPGTSNTDLEVDLGDYSLFTPTQLNYQLPQLAVADLTAVFGSNWASTVQWSVAGIDGSMAKSFLLTSTSATNVRTSSDTTLGGDANTIAQLTTGGAGAGSLNGAVATPNSASSAYIGGSLGTNVNNTTGTVSSQLSQSIEGLGASSGYGFSTTAEQTGAGSLYLYDFQPGVQTGSGLNKKYPLAPLEGVFVLGTDGSLVFNPTATPEPSAYALGICALLLFWVLKRRQSVA